MTTRGRKIIGAGTLRATGVVVGALAGAFLTVAIVASAATMTTALLANLIAIPALSAALFAGAWRIGCYGVIAGFSCVAVSVLVEFFKLQAEYLIVSIYLWLFLVAVALLWHYRAKKAQTRDDSAPLPPT